MIDIGKMLGIKRDMTSQSIVQTDICRYKRNKLASGLALLGLVFECLYFMLFYSLLFGVSGPYYTFLIGFSVLVNLAVLLVTFLSSEGVKVYNKKYCIPLIVVGVVQIARIFIYPLDLALGGNYLYESANTVTAWYFGNELSAGVTSTILIVYLILSAACMFAAAGFGYIRARQLEIFNASLEKGDFTVEAALEDLKQKEESSGSDAAGEEVNNA